jgi:DNA-directed RNA polymerase subunit E'/Rpb7
MSVRISKKICLDPEYLDNQIYKHLLEKLNKTYKNECSKDIGYILNINKIININNNYISPANSSIVFDVTVDATILKPEKDLQVEGRVFMVFNNGIFIEVIKNFKILVLKNSLAGYKFDQQNLSYTKGKKVIKNDDIIKVKISGVKYEKKTFCCFAEMLEK